MMINSYLHKIKPSKCHMILEEILESNKPIDLIYKSTFISLCRQAQALLLLQKL